MTNYILLMRHCESKKHAKLGFTLDELTDFGEAQSRRIAESLDFDIKYIVSSPHKRAYKCAEIIAKQKRTSPIIDERWKELSRGVYTERPYSEFIAEWAKYGNNYDYVPPEGESVNQGRNRIIEGFREMIKKNQNVLCITHAGLISNLLMMLYSFEFERGNPSYGGICELISKENEIVLEPTENNFFLKIPSAIVAPLSKLSLRRTIANKIT